MCTRCSQAHGVTLRCSCARPGVDLMILMGLFQLRIFCDSKTETKTAILWRTEVCIKSLKRMLGAYDSGTKSSKHFNICVHWIVMFSDMTYSNSGRWYAVANLLSPISIWINTIHFHMLICVCNMGKLLIPFQVCIVAKVFIHSVKREPFNILPCHQRQIERPF